MAFADPKNDWVATDILTAVEVNKLADNTIYLKGQDGPVDIEDTIEPTDLLLDGSTAFPVPLFDTGPGSSYGITTTPTAVPDLSLVTTRGGYWMLHANIVFNVDSSDFNVEFLFSFSIGLGARAPQARYSTDSSQGIACLHHIDIVDVPASTTIEIYASKSSGAGTASQVLSSQNRIFATWLGPS